MKKSIKKVTPSYTVNLDEIESLSDIDVVFALAKHNAGIALSDNELYDIVKYVADITAKSVRPSLIFVDCTDCFMCKKQPWYKRAWKKIKGVFTR